MINKGHGGSYRRNEDGSIQLIERTGWKRPKSKSESKRRKEQDKTRKVKGEN